jgi:undecaprenyl diphosphate synthase
MASTLQHLALIMDGNGRWAQLKNKPRTFGHIKGARVAKKMITHASDLGIKYLTLYAFSTENWLRPQDEVGFLMRLLERYLIKETENLIKKNIRFTIIGDQTRLPAGVQKQVQNSIQKTSHCTGLQVCFAISYGSRQEITNAVQKIAGLVAEKRISVNQITEELIQKNLMTGDIPDPDLILRTSGESRLSNFLMWQAAYSELIFSKILWPDFTTQDFDECCKDFYLRNRRFGKVSAELNF